MEPEDNLSFYDSEDSYDYDDDFYEKFYHEQEIEPKSNIISVNVIPNLNNDMLKEILKHGDMKSFVKLCDASKNMKNICNNDLWKYKMKQQYNVIIDENYTFDEWKKMYHYLSFDNKAKYIIKWLYDEQDNKILLKKPIDYDMLVNMIKSIGYKTAPFKSIPFSIINLSFHYSTNPNATVYYENIHEQKYYNNIYGFRLTNDQLKQLIQQLLYKGYL